MSNFTKDQAQSFLNNLAEQAGGIAVADEGVLRHDDTNPEHRYISLPGDMAVREGARELTQKAADLDEEKNFRKIFNYPYEDGAYAVAQVMQRAFRTRGRGVPIHSMFGTELPAEIEIVIGLDHDGREIKASIFDRGTKIEFLAVEGTIQFFETEHREYGSVFALQITAKKRYSTAVENLFTLIERQLKDHSIYRGKTWRNNAVGAPKFLNLKQNHSIVYNKDTYALLESGVLNRLKQRDLAKKENIKTNTKSLLFGTFGTGKTEFGLLTAEVANQNGVTFIQHDATRQGIEGLKRARSLAVMFSPSVLFIEDVDQYMREDGTSLSELTNLFDGPETKEHDVAIMMTTNYVDGFPPAMIRSGRIDHYIPIGLLNREAQEEMMYKVLGDKLRDDVDFDRVYESMTGYSPADIRGTFEIARTNAIFRVGSSDYELSTEDLVVAAESKRPQWEMQQKLLNKAEPEPTLDRAFSDAVEKAVEQISRRVVRTEVSNFTLDMEDGDLTYGGKTEILQDA